MIQIAAGFNCISAMYQSIDIAKALRAVNALIEQSEEEEFLTTTYDHNDGGAE
jgi:hypothetical protein